MSTRAELERALINEAMVWYHTSAVTHAVPHDGDWPLWLACDALSAAMKAKLRVRDEKQTGTRRG